jgi:hypothetical protein
MSQHIFRYLKFEQTQCAHDEDFLQNTYKNCGGNHNILGLHIEGFCLENTQY